MPDLWYGTSGPPDADIVLVGEAWGENEAREKRPFVGASGIELNRMLAAASLSRNSILCTNVAAIHPPNNNMWHLFHPHERDIPTIQGLAPNDELKNEIQRLYAQINYKKRKLVIASGNYPLWALTNCTKANHPTEESQGRKTPTGISNWRGSMWYMLSNRLDPMATYTDTPLLPIIHPSAIMRDWSRRAETIHDLSARVPLALAGDWRPSPQPTMLAPPTFEQVIKTLQNWLWRAESEEFYLTCDIETARSLITCIGVGDSINFAMCIPFIQRTEDGFDSYWEVDQEVEILKFLRNILTHRAVKIQGQNFLYDTQYIQEWFGITPKLSFDSMLAQNLIAPGTPKGLDYLSSLYCKYHWYWKEDGKEWDTRGTLNELLLYNCIDIIRTHECCETLRNVIVQLGQTSQWEIKLRINDLCLKMMNRGVKIDQQRRVALRITLSEHLTKLYERLLYIIPQDFVQPGARTPWFKSAKQCMYLFYDRLGLKPILHRKTKRPTSGSEALNELPKKNPEWTKLFDLINEVRSVSNTLQVLTMQLDSDGRMRCSYNPAGTETHRLSSSKNAFGRGMNLQNITKGMED